LKIDRTTDSVHLLTKTHSKMPWLTISGRLVTDASSLLVAESKLVYSNFTFVDIKVKTICL